MTRPWRRQVLLYAAVASFTSGCGLFIPAISALGDSLSKPAPGASSSDATTQAKQSARRPGASSRVPGSGGASGGPPLGGNPSGVGSSGEVGDSAPSGTEGAIGAGAPPTSGSPGAGDSAGLAGSDYAVERDVIADPGETSPDLGEVGAGSSGPATGPELGSQPEPRPGSILVQGSIPPKAGNAFMDFLEDVKKYQARKQASPTR